MEKPKVLLIQEDVKSYRTPIYELINREVDLTVACTLKNEIKESTFKIINFPYFKIGPAIIHQGVSRLLNQYDAVILLPHLKFVWLDHIVFTRHRYKVLTWSIGKHVSYDRPYDLSTPPSWMDRVFEGIQDRADACIFYMPDPIAYWKKYKDIDTDKYFVAHNTVKIEDFDTLPPFAARDSFLFIGTLYAQKGIGELIEAYSKAKEKAGKLPPLNIIGKGPEKEAIEQQIDELGLKEDIQLCGPIYEESALKDYFFKSILCISPKQAGLSVLKSLGYGVPFVTHTDAITGGEKTNIVDGENGLFYDTVDQLVSILTDASENPEKYSTMSQIARNYYLTQAPPEKMARGVLDAIKYALRQ
ncbi:MAG: glycosyltransferase family 4 protein [Prevotella sp.]|nr:glycosyltransferase family 4 protein [Prevotella sp.]